MLRPSFVNGAALVLINALFLASLVIFGRGFFPYKPVLPGLGEYDDLHLGPSPTAPFDRLVFIVIDALRRLIHYGMPCTFGQRTDQWLVILSTVRDLALNLRKSQCSRLHLFLFLFSFSWAWTFILTACRLIRAGNAFPYTAHARSPTVTMPRLKALTTGSIPSFLDVLLNLDESDSSSTLSTQDTWLAQMKRKHLPKSETGTGKLVMYGDDTWLKLFPETFDRADGTMSFFVADFTEVDNNVTRHVGAEMGRNDWNVMVLHYLGLDHIGHKTGPRR